MGFYEFFLVKIKRFFYTATSSRLLKPFLREKKFLLHDNKIDLILSFFPLFSCTKEKNLDNTEKRIFSFASISMLHILLQIFFFKVVPCVVKNKHFSLTPTFFSSFQQHSKKLLCFIKIEKSFNIMRNYSRNLFIYKNLSLSALYGTSRTFERWKRFFFD